MKRILGIFLLLLLIGYHVAEGGTITYEIWEYTEDEQGRLLAKGVKNHTPQEIKVDKPQKSLYLEKGLSIGLSDDGNNVLKGFGMWIENKSGGFSWEWFNLSEDNIFKKLLEGGSVRVKTSGEPLFQEITEVEFLTDISLRLEDMKTDKPTHRVNIKKGSVLSLPPIYSEEDINVASKSNVKIIKIEPNPSVPLKIGSEIHFKANVEYELKKHSATISLFIQKGEYNVRDVRDADVRDVRDAVVGFTSKVIWPGKGIVILEKTVKVPDTKVLQVFTPLDFPGQGPTTIVDKKFYKVVK